MILATCWQQRKAQQKCWYHQQLQITNIRRIPNFFINFSTSWFHVSLSLWNVLYFWAILGRVCARVTWNPGPLRTLELVIARAIFDPQKGLWHQQKKTGFARLGVGGTCSQFRLLPKLRAWNVYLYGILFQFKHVGLSLPAPIPSLKSVQTRLALA